VCEVQARLHGIVLNIDYMIKDVKSGKFFEEEGGDVFDELDELD